MKTVVSVMLAAFLFGTVSLLFVAKKANDRLEGDLVATKSETDSLLKKNEFLDHGVKGLERQRDSLSTKNKAIEKSLAQGNFRLASKEREISKAMDEGDKKYNDLAASHTDLEKQLASLKVLNDQVGHENKSLTLKIGALTDDNQKLNEQLTSVRLTSKDDILVETLGKNGKLNVKGGKVRKIVVSLDLPSEFKKSTFRIFDPNGVPLPDPYSSINLKSNQGEASSAPPGGVTKTEMTYLLPKKIGAGLYRIELLNENKHMGNLLVRFR